MTDHPILPWHRAAAVEIRARGVTEMDTATIIAKHYAEAQEVHGDGLSQDYIDSCDGSQIGHPPQEPQAQSAVLAQFDKHAENIMQIVDGLEQRLRRAEKERDALLFDREHGEPLTEADMFALKERLRNADTPQHEDHPNPPGAP